MSDNQEPINISDDIVVIGPGQMLRDARIALGLSEAEVSEHLNLRLALIINIEKEEFDANIPATFLRGYLKNYAKFVGVKQTDIIASYEMLAVAEKQGGEMKSFSQSTRKKAENNRLMMTIYIIVFALVALFVVWWWQEANMSEAEVVTSTSEQVEQEEQPTQVATEDAAIITSELAEEEPADKAFEQHMANSDELTNPDANVVEEDNIAIVENESVPVSEPVIEQVTQLEQLVFQFSGDCWVNIFDATGERLAWGIKKADYIMTLKGKAPFSITLGKPELVSIGYNEVAIDMSQFQQGQIAKFTWPKS